MKKQLFTIVIFIIVLASVQTCIGLTQKEVVDDFSLGELSFHDVEGYSYVNIDGLNTISTPGEPVLPIKSFIVDIPKDANINSVELTNVLYKEYDDLKILPNKDPISKEISEGAVYDINKYYPSSELSYEIGEDNYAKHVMIKLYPIQYNPVESKIKVMQEAKIRVSYSFEKPLFFQPLSMLSFETESIIITPPEFYDYAKQLADFHENTEGISTAVINTTWIYENYNEASDIPYTGYKDTANTLSYDYDNAKKIISFLKDNHQNLKYVTLVGDASYVPPSYYIYDQVDLGPYGFGPSSSSYHSWIPTDFFYTSPDYDLSPNYMVGRLPVTTVNESRDLINKIINWHSQDWDWFNNVVLAAGRPQDTEFYVGEMTMIEAVNEGYFSGMNIEKQFRTSNNFDRDNMLNALSGDNGFIYHIGHGSGNELELKRNSRKVVVSDLMNLPANDKVPIFVSAGCSNGFYDGRITDDGVKTSFAQGLLNSKAGAIAYLGSSRVSFGATEIYIDSGELKIIDSYYIEDFTNRIFESYSTGSNTLGKTTNDALNFYVANNDMSDKYSLRTLFEFTLLGDPALLMPYTSTNNGYDKPTINPIDNSGYIEWDDYGTIPEYKTIPMQSISLEISSDAPVLRSKLIELNSESTISNFALNPIGGKFEYSVTPLLNRKYMFRAITPDEKETWFYLYANETFKPELTGSFEQNGFAIRNQPKNILVLIKNEGNSDAINTQVALRENGHLIGTNSIDEIKEGDRTVVSFNWVPTRSGNKTLRLIITNSEDADESNNIIYHDIVVAEDGLDIQINSPNEDNLIIKPPVNLEFSTNIDAKCLYNLNNLGFKKDISWNYGTSFNTVLKDYHKGENSLEIKCNTDLGDEKIVEITFNTSIIGNRKPSLDGATVYPTEGYRDTVFRFNVTYRDPDNEAPTFVDINNIYNMVGEGNSYVEGVEYSYELSGLDIGEYDFKIFANDGQEGAETYNDLHISVTNKRPVIDSKDPANNIFTIEDGTTWGFGITKSDSDNDPVSVEWIVDDFVKKTDSDSFSFQFVLIKEYNVSVVIDDGYSDVMHTWTVEVVDDLSQKNQEIYFKKGWNLISINNQPENANIDSLLSEVNYKSIWKFDSESNSWKTYTKGIGGSFDSLEPGVGYWINVKSDSYVVVSGVVLSSNEVELKKGWNLLPYNSIQSSDISVLLKDIDYSTIWKWGADENRWFSYKKGLGGSFNKLEPGVAYWINVNKASVLEY